MSQIEQIQSPGSAYIERKIDRIRERWDSRAFHWDAELKKTGCHLNLDDAYNRFLRFALDRLMVLSQRHSPSILDLGCGTGIVALEVAASARFVIGVDISSSMILRAREKSIPCSTFIVADAFALPIKDSTIDTVMSRGVLISHYGRRHAENFFNEVARVIIPGGIFIIDYLHAGGRKFFPYETVYKTYFNKEYISILADRTGFALGQIDGGEISRVHIIELVKL